MITQNHQIISSHEMAERFLDFEIRRFKNQKKIRKTKTLMKVHRPGSISDQLGRKQELQNQLARLRSESTRRTLDISHGVR